MALKLTIISEQRDAARGSAPASSSASAAAASAARTTTTGCCPIRSAICRPITPACSSGAAPIYLLDTSTNGVFVNDGTVPLGRRDSYPLRDGDRLRLGDYLLGRQHRRRTRPRPPRPARSSRSTREPRARLAPTSAPRFSLRELTDADACGNGNGGSVNAVAAAAVERRSMPSVRPLTEDSACSHSTATTFRVRPLRAVASARPHYARRDARSRRGAVDDPPASRPSVAAPASMPGSCRPRRRRGCCSSPDCCCAKPWSA